MWEGACSRRGPHSHQNLPAAIAGKPAPTFDGVHTSKCGRGLAPEGALTVTKISLPPSQASQLPHLTRFTHQNVGGGLLPKRPSLSPKISLPPSQASQREHSQPVGAGLARDEALTTATHSAT